jgi:serine/threonine-protein kinase
MYQVLHKIVAGEFERPSIMKPDLDPAFEAVVVKAMASTPDDRYPTVTALGAALLPFASTRTRAVWAPLFDKSAVAEWETQPPMRREAAYSEPISQANVSHTINQPHSSVDIHPPDRRRALMVGGVVLCVLAAFVVYLAMPASEPTVIATPVPPEKPKTAETSLPPKHLVETDAVAISATPSSARIVIDGDELGTGTYQGKMLKDGRTHELVVRADGYTAFRTVFTDVAPAGDITLERAETARATHKVVRRRTTTRRRPVETTVRKVEAKTSPKKGANDALIIR